MDYLYDIYIVWILSGRQDNNSENTRDGWAYQSDASVWIASPTLSDLVGSACKVLID